MATIDRLKGARTTKAIKGPVLAATTANITLSGEQTIDGVALVTGDRVLVKDQTDGTENGIYVVDTGAWGRAADFNKSDDIDEGTLVAIAQGTTQSSSMYILQTPDAEIATTVLAFARYADPAGVAVADAAAAAALASEIAAAASETAAAGSEAAADADRIAAQAAAAAAALSETNAGNSEAAAAASETASGLSETAAALSESNAGTSETNAAASAAAALTSEGNASTSETNAAASEAAADADRIAAQAAAAAAALSETNAGNSETAAGLSETAAALSETNAGNSETAALAAQGAAEAALDEFTDLYLGAFAANPTLDNDGNPLQDGALYWNNVALEIRAYDLGGTTWYTSPSFNPSAYALTGGDTFTGDLRVEANLIVSRTDPQSILEETDQGVDGKIWRYAASGGSMYFQTRTDVLGVGQDAYRIDRSGVSISDHVFYTGGGERMRIQSAQIRMPTQLNMDAAAARVRRTSGSDDQYIELTPGTASQHGVLTGFASSDKPMDIRNLAHATQIVRFLNSIGVTAAQVEDGGTAMAGTKTIVTREKGDARYAQLAGAEFTGDVQITGTNPTIVLEDSDAPSILNELSLQNASLTVDLDINSNTSAAGFNVDYQGSRLFAINELGTVIGVQNSAQNRSLKIVATDAIQVPNGTTAQRPGTAEAGDFRFNTTTGAFEGYDGSVWAAVGGGGGAVLLDTIDLTAFGAGNVDFALPDGYFEILVRLIDVGTDSVGSETAQLRFSTDGGSTFLNTSGDYGYRQVDEVATSTGAFSSADNITIVPIQASGTAGIVDGDISITRYQEAGYKTLVSSKVMETETTFRETTGVVNTAAAHDFAQLSIVSGVDNFDEGTIEIWGIPKA